MVCLKNNLAKIMWNSIALLKKMFAFQYYPYYYLNIMHGKSMSERLHILCIMHVMLQ